MQPVTKKYCWYVLYTRCLHEGKAEEYLNRNSIEVYLPRHKVLRQWSDRKKWIEVPLFPSYIFVRVSCREYQKALQHHSIVKYITIGGCPCFVPDEQINAIKVLLNSQLKFEVIQESYEIGDSVVFCEGPLTGYSAEVINRKGEKELLLRIDGTQNALLILSKCEYVKKSLVCSQLNPNFVPVLPSPSL